MNKKVLSILLTLVMLMGIFAPAGILTASAASVIEGTTGAGTEADPLIVDDYGELQAALAYDGTLYIVAKSFPTEKLKLLYKVETPFLEVVSKKVLTLKQSIDVECLGGGNCSLFSVKDGADFTIIADGRRKIKHTYTVLELAGPNAKAALKGELIIETTTDDGSQSSYALVAHQGNILIDGAYTEGDHLRISSASLKNNAAVFKNGTVDGKVALTGTAFRLYPGSVGFLRDEEQDFTTVPNFGAAEVVREDLRVACIGGFNEQSPALEGTDATITAPEEKFFLGMSKKYTFSTANNTGWAEKFVYTPTGTIEVIDSTGNIIYSISDSDSGIFDKNVDLTIDLSYNYFTTPGKYKIRETISLTRNGTEVSKCVHIYPIDVVSFNNFLGQNPAMPDGKKEFYLGEVKQASYPVEFSAHSLPQSMIDEGYKSIAILKVYLNNTDNTYVYGEKAYCDKGQKISYDLNELPAGIYKLVETIEICDKNNKAIKAHENTFYIDWTPQQDIKEVNITADWQGNISAPVCTTKGVKITKYVWEESIRSGWATLDSSDIFKLGSGYRLTVTVAAESGYKLDDSYTVKIDGEPATLKDGKWQVSKRITAYVNFVDIEHSNAPEAGTYPEFDGYEIVQAGNTSVSNVEWFKCDKDGIKLSEPLTAEDMFEKDSYYLLEVSTVTARGYRFDKNAAFYINGDSVNCNTISGGLKGYKIYHVDDAEGKYELYLYDGSQTGAAKDIIIKDGQYIASDSATPVTTKPSGGYAYYKDGVLTFEAYNNAKAHFVFEEGNLDVYLKGRNRIGAIYNSEYLGELNGLDKREGNMTISADENGSLTVASNPLDAYCNIYVNTLTFNSGKVVSCLANGTYGSALYAEKLIIADGYKAYVGETNDFDASEEWNGITDIKDYENVWLDKAVCRHSYVKYEKADATCVAEGVKETFELCQDCKLSVKKENGEILTGDDATAFLADVIIPKGDHAYKFIEKHASTCNSTGAKSSYWICTVCNGMFVTDAKTPITLHEYSKNIHLPKLSHQLTAVPEKAADCENDGNIAYWVCGRDGCGKYFSDDAANNEIGTADVVVPATGHTEEVIPGKASTETETGLTDGKKCSVCGQILKEQEIIDKLPVGHVHEYTDTVVAPTCKDKGYTKHECACGNSYIDSYVEKTDVHTPVVIPGKAATTTETGLTDGEKCSVCGTVTKEQTVIDKIPEDHKHTPGEWVVVTPAEVGVEGKEVKKCSDCNAVVEERVIPALENPDADIMLGDVNKDGKITAADARLALRISAKLDTADEYRFVAADMDKNGKITAADARKILRISAKLD